MPRSPVLNTLAGLLHCRGVGALPLLLLLKELLHGLLCGSVLLPVLGLAPSPLVEPCPVPPRALPFKTLTEDSPKKLPETLAGLVACRDVASPVLLFLLGKELLHALLHDPERTETPFGSSLLADREVASPLVETLPLPFLAALPHARMFKDLLHAREAALPLVLVLLGKEVLHVSLVWQAFLRLRESA